jgi:uncharacterized membrane protein YhiD involved in acid resistance
MQQKFGFGIDPTRITAQIVTGVGFLGAGTIIHYKGNKVNGDSSNHSRSKLLSYIV